MELFNKTGGVTPDIYPILTTRSQQEISWQNHNTRYT